MPHDYSVQDILKAKQIVRKNGYDVSLPDNKIDIAKNIAHEAGYSVKKSTSQFPNRTVKPEPRRVPQPQRAPTPERAPEVKQETKPTPPRYKTTEDIAASFL